MITCDVEARLGTRGGQIIVNSNIHIVCPHCGFSKEVHPEKVPQGNVRVTCPKCRQAFPLHPFLSAGVAPEVPHLDSPPNGSQPFAPLSVAALSVEQGGARAKRTLLFFVFLIIVLLGVRLWADSKMRSVPFPNLIAVSECEVAVTWGEDIYFLDHAGKVLRTLNIPAGVVPTQLKYVGNELWLGDYAGKTVKRLRNDAFETVIDGSGRFHGAFKFAVDPEAGQIFVVDSANHQVLSFGMDGRNVGSFGSVGKGEGELLFPNTVVFDPQGRLLIVNTNAGRVDMFERSGAFVGTAVHVRTEGMYRYPTFLAQAGDRLVLLLTVDLRETKVQMYDSGGKYVGELQPTKPLREAGDIAALAGRVLVSDNKERKVYAFSADTLACQGPFSVELETLGNEALELETLYRNLANGALLALIGCLLPVILLYVQVRRNELKAITASDLNRVIPPEALWTSGVDRRTMISGAAILAICPLLLAGVLPLSRISFPAAFVLLLAAVVCGVAGWLVLVVKSGYGNPAREKPLSRLLKLSYGKVVRLLLPGERIQVLTAAKLTLLSNRTALLLCTDRRLLVMDLSVESSGIRQIGYGDIATAALEPITFPSSLFNIVLGNNAFGLSLTLKEQADKPVVTFAAEDRHLLERLRRFVDGRTAGTRLGVAVLCDSCYKPAGPDGCPACAAARRENWKPLVLSLLYPGFGQFYSRELMHGTIACSLFSAGIVCLTVPAIKIMNRSAEVTSWDAHAIGQNVAGMLFIYTVSCIDADLKGRKGRKLFSSATGDVVRMWLKEKMKDLQPSWKNRLIELVPGVAHALAGKYRRAMLFLIPLAYLLWTACWSLLVDAWYYEEPVGLYFFSFASVLVCTLWAGMNIDGIRRLEQRPPLPITGRSMLSLLAKPLVTFAGAFVAQLLFEIVIFADPAVSEAIASPLEQLGLLLGRERSLSLGARMFLGWGGAVMALCAVMAREAGKSRMDVVKDASVGFIGGVACWILSNILLDGVVGSMVLMPVLFGPLVGIFLFRRFRDTGISALLVPAVVAGTVIGHTASVLAVELMFALRRLGLGDHNTLAFMVAIPAYFMHLSYLVLHATMSRKGRESGYEVNLEPTAQGQL